MKKNLTGSEAFMKAISASLPILKRKRKTQDPDKISHNSIIPVLRKEIYKAGLEIKSEIFMSCPKGKNFYTCFVLDSLLSSSHDYNMCLQFTNSYKKPNAFNVSLGFINNKTNVIGTIPMKFLYASTDDFSFLNHNKHEEILKENVLKNILINHSSAFKTLTLNILNINSEVNTVCYSTISKLIIDSFITDNLLNSYDIITLKDAITNPNHDLNIKHGHISKSDSLHQIFSEILMNSHPEDYIENQEKLFYRFVNSLKSEELGIFVFKILVKDPKLTSVQFISNPLSVSELLEIQKYENILKSKPKFLGSPEYLAISTTSEEEEIIEEELEEIVFALKTEED